MRRISSLSRDASGATAVEYGLIIAAFAGAILAVLFFLGSTINRARNDVTGGVRQDTQSSPDGGWLLHGSGGK